MALTDLPPELVGHIADCLNRADILNLRLTCQRLYKESLSTFATTFFSTITLDLCPEPLRRLHRIAHDDFLRLHVRQVVIAEMARGCPNRPRHSPGSGHHWTRGPSSQYLDPLRNPVISEFRVMLSRLVNLHSVAIKDDVALEPEPLEPENTGLCLMDAIHIGLVAVANLPIKSFRVLKSSLMRGWVHSLLPRSVLLSLSPSWATTLVDLRLTGYPLRDDGRDDCASIMVELVLRAQSLRRLSVCDGPAEFYRRLAAEPADVFLPPLKMLDLKRLEGPSEVLTSFVSRFSSTLEHLYILFMRLEPGGWETTFANWAADLRQLKSFGLDGIFCGRDPAGNMKKVLFDSILEWEGAPGAGDMLLAARRSRPRQQGVTVTGVMYRGQNEDVLMVLATMAEMGCVVTRDAGYSGITLGELKRLDKQYLIAGRLVAKEVRLFYPPEFEL